MVVIVHYERTGPFSWREDAPGPATFSVEEAESWPNLDSLIRCGYVRPVFGEAPVMDPSKKIQLPADMLEPAAEAVPDAAPAPDLPPGPPDPAARLDPQAEVALDEDQARELRRVMGDPAAGRPARRGRSRP